MGGHRAVGGQFLGIALLEWRQVARLAERMLGGLILACYKVLAQSLR